MGLLCCALTSCEKENHLFNEDQDGLIVTILFSALT